jgi:hypothetical protein
MTVWQSQEICRRLFRAERAAGRVFYAVNRKYNALLRLPTPEEIAGGLVTQEATKLARVRPTQVIITLADEQWKPVHIDTPDGRCIPDQWPKSIDAVPKCYTYTGKLSADGALRATCKPGRPCAYILLTKPLTLMWGRGEEHWPAGNFMSCWNEVKMDCFTSISPPSFAAMHEPADAASAQVLAQLRGQK